ncbi:MAG: hypothetical protein AAGF11_41130 [Myxococcota bacterium]
MRMPLIVRAIITGFGYKIGSELGRYVATKIGLVERDKAKAEEAEEELPDGIPINPPGDGDDGGDGGGEAEAKGLFKFWSRAS